MGLDPDPARGSNNRIRTFTGIFAEDGNYIGYVMVWHCDEFALIPDLSFGIDDCANA